MANVIFPVFKCGYRESLNGLLKSNGDMMLENNTFDTYNDNGYTYGYWWSIGFTYILSNDVIVGTGSDETT